MGDPAQAHAVGRSPRLDSAPDERTSRVEPEGKEEEEEEEPAGASAPDSSPGQEDRGEREQLLADLKAQLERRGDDPRTAAAVADLEAELAEVSLTSEKEADVDRIAEKFGMEV